MNFFSKAIILLIAFISLSSFKKQQVDEWVYEREKKGIKVFTKKYPPGITTNLILENFFEAEMTIICDPWIDKNALVDTARLKKPVLALCDTNNFTTNVTKLIPCNNKSKKSIGCILFILAREYCKIKKIPFSATLIDFAGDLE